MSTITFENNDKTQKIVIEITETEEGMKADCTFDPKV